MSKGSPNLLLQPTWHCFHLLHELKHHVLPAFHVRHWPECAVLCDSVIEKWCTHHACKDKTTYAIRTNWQMGIFKNTRCMLEINRNDTMHTSALSILRVFKWKFTSGIEPNRLADARWSWIGSCLQGKWTMVFIQDAHQLPLHTLWSGVFWFPSIIYMVFLSHFSSALSIWEQENLVAGAHLGRMNGTLYKFARSC